MGMPAARLGDLTAHGGTIVLGLPTVIIGGQPAARVGDMHVCPMVTGIVPHVGGPIILGSPTVLTGFQLQARVGDMLVCVGPPDIIAMGCPTVLVGMAGAPGGAGLVGAMVGSALATAGDPDGLTGAPGDATSGAGGPGGGGGGGGGPDASMAGAGGAGGPGATGGAGGPDT